jgi:integrase/recombinase XerD
MQAPLLETKDFEKLFAHAETMKRPVMYRLLTVLMRDLGLRPIELAHMQSNWFSGSEMRVPHGQSKRKRPRTLPTSQEIRDLVREHMQGRKGHVFLNRDGNPFSPIQMSDTVRRFFRVAGAEGSTYSGRRTLATRLVDAKENILIVQAVLGHSDPATTARYVSVTQKMVARALFA